MAADLRIYCNSCAGVTRHGTVRIYEQDTADGKSVVWQIVRCGGCDSISCHEEHWIEGEQDWEITEWFTYPLRQYRAPKQFPDAPAIIDQIYRETIGAFNNSALLLCAGGLRALVEGICADQNILDGPKRDHTTGQFVRHRESNEVVRKTTLDCKIEGLAENNILTERQAQLLHEHRYLGNMALHELAVPEKDVLIVAINLIEHVMEDLYSIPAQADGLRRIRQESSR